MKLENKKDIQEHIFVFLNLLVVILKRRALFGVFERNLKGKDTHDEISSNAFVSYYITDYTRGQFIDLRKFFETDRSSYKISDLINYIDSQEIRDVYEKLKQTWTEEFKNQVDKLIAHLDRDSGALEKEVKKININAFIDAVDNFVVLVIKGLRGKGTLILQDELRDPEGYFLKIKPCDEFKKYLGWTCKSSN